MTTSLLFTCEHGGNEIPVAFRSAFRTAQSALQSHRGYDPGALELARKLARRWQAPFEYETRSRLLIELNRSPGHPRLFSEFSRKLPEEVREELIREIYLPYRERITKQVETMSRGGSVLHLSIHSFTPVMDGKTRRTDIGLLFDPARPMESDFAARWKKSLQVCLPELAIHFNLPYRGTSDGFTTTLRTQFPDQRYAGIELEVNQKFPQGDPALWKAVQQGIQKSLQTALPADITRALGFTKGT